MRYAKYFRFLLAAVFAPILVGGCAGSNPLQLSNRVACTVSGDGAYVIGTSLMFFGGGAVPIDAKDVPAITRACKDQLGNVPIK